MVGLMIAAMFSATASMVDSQLNVFAGVLTRDFYRRMLHPNAGERHLMRVGRIIMVALGIVLLGAALAVPFLGGAEKTALGIAALLISPLMLPTIWGLFSRRIDRSAVWLTVAVSFTASAVVKFGFGKQGWFAGVERLAPLLAWVQPRFRTIETLVAVLVPSMVLLALEIMGRGTDPGWLRVAEVSARLLERTPPRPSRLPARMVGWSVLILGVLVGLPAVFDHTSGASLLGAAAVVLFAVATVIFCFARDHRSKDA